MKLRSIILAVIIAILAIGGGYQILTLQDHIMDLRQAGRPLDLKRLRPGQVVHMITEMQTHEVDDLNRPKQTWAKSTSKSWILVDDPQTLGIDGLTPVRKVVTGRGGIVYNEQIHNQEMDFVGFPQIEFVEAFKRQAPINEKATDEEIFQRLLEVEGTSLIRTVSYPGGEAYQTRTVYPASDSELGIVDRYFDKRTFWPLATEEWRSKFLGLSQRLVFWTINRRFERQAAAEATGLFDSPKGLKAWEAIARQAKPPRIMTLKAFAGRAPKPDFEVYTPAGAPRSFGKPAVYDDTGNPRPPSVRLEYTRLGRQTARIEVASGPAIHGEILGAGSPVKKQVDLRLRNLPGRPVVKAFILNAPAEVDDHSTAIAFKIDKTWVTIRTSRMEPTNPWPVNEKSPSVRAVGLFGSNQLIKLASTVKKL